MKSVRATAKFDFFANDENPIGKQLLTSKID
jgi:hypothetical protein